MARRSSSSVRSGKRGPGRKGYRPEKRAEILSTAKRESLTGAQVQKRFGISTLTFYRWRGPVRRRRPAGRGRKSGATVDTSVIRAAVRTQVQKMLPRIIREEVERAL